jgi:predicted SAM-dependent methyltransferase
MIRKALSELREALANWPSIAWSTATRRKAIQTYLANTDIPKLHVGCGPHHLYGWLNTDIVISNGAIYLDATQPLPFPENTFSFIFSEHMLEHIPIDAAQVFMQECNRVLKPGGVLRLATPDMAFLFELWEGNNPNTAARYFKNAARHFVKYPSFANKCTTINNFFYNWGHRFIYDEETIVHVMRLSNFQRIQRVKVGESDIAALQGLERHGLSISDEFNKLETMVMEGTKPNKNE